MTVYKVTIFDMQDAVLTENKRTFLLQTDEVVDNILIAKAIDCDLLPSDLVVVETMKLYIV